MSLLEAAAPQGIASCRDGLAADTYFTQQKSAVAGEVVERGACEGPFEDDDCDDDRSPLVTRQLPASPSSSTSPLRRGSRHDAAASDFVQNPYEKLVRRGKLPYKLLLNVVVLALLVFQLAWVEVESAKADFDETKALETWLSPPSSSPGSADVLFHKRGELSRAVSDVVRNYFAVADEALADVDYYAASSSSSSSVGEAPMVLVAEFSQRNFRLDPISASCSQGSNVVVSKDLYRDGGVELAISTIEGNPSEMTVEQSHDLDTAVCAPRRDLADPTLWYSPCRSVNNATFYAEDFLCSVMLTAALRQTLHSSRPDAVFSRTTFNFDIALECQRVVSFGLFRCALTIDTQMRRSHARLQLALLLLVALVLASLLDVLLRVKALRKVYVFRTRSEERQDEHDEEGAETVIVDDEDGKQQRLPQESFEAEWHASLLKDLGESWHYWAIACHVLTCAYAAVAMCEAFEVSLTANAAYGKRIVLGAACFASSLQFLGFLRFFRRVYFLIKATRRSIPRLAPFLAGALPIFFGSACFATIVFGAHSGGEFATLFSSATALFTAMFGDSLLRAFDRAGDTSSRLVQVCAGVFFVLYILLFMSAILNIALATVMEVYTELRGTYGIVLHEDEHGAAVDIGIDRKITRRARWRLARDEALAALEKLKLIAMEAEEEELAEWREREMQRVAL